MKLSTCCAAPEHALNGFCSDCKEHAEFEEVRDDYSNEGLSPNDKHGVTTPETVTHTYTACPHCHEETSPDDLYVVEAHRYEEFWGSQVRVDESYTQCPHCGEDVCDDELEEVEYAE